MYIYSKINLLNCREVVDSEEFLALSHQQVARLISSDRLTVSTEEKVIFLTTISYTIKIY